MHELWCDSRSRSPQSRTNKWLSQQYIGFIAEFTIEFKRKEAILITVFVHLGIYVKLAGKAFPHDSLPTGTLAVFDVDASNWSPIERKNCRLIDFLRPKALRAKGK